MKKLTLLFITSFVLLITISCDKIEGPYVEQNGQVAVCDTPIFSAISNPIQKIILEEFTGQTCVNCPQGHKIAANLKTKYADTIVVMSIHAGSFADPIANTIFTADYRTSAGAELNSFFGVQGYPSGMVNRTDFMGSVVLDKSAWTSAANAIVRTNPILAIQIKAVDHSSDNSVCVFTKTTFLQNTQKNIKLSLFLIEDSIVSPQSNNTASIGTVPEIIDYVHRHVLRGAINSVWGDQIASLSTLSIANSFVIKGYSYSFSGKPFVKDNCSIIAVAYDTDTKSVIQVEEISLVE